MSFQKAQCIGDARHYLPSHTLVNSPCTTPSRGRTIIHSLLGQGWTTVQIWTNQILSSGIFGINILGDCVNKLLEAKLKGPADSEQRPPFGKSHRGLGLDG